jgi:hypothetical protein
MVIEEYESSRPIIVDRLHGAVGFAGMVLNLGFFLCFPESCSFSLPLARMFFYGTPYLVRAIAALIVFTA